MGGVHRRETYPLLCEATGALVLGISEQLDDTLLVRGKTNHKSAMFHIVHNRAAAVGSIGRIQCASSVFRRSATLCAGFHVPSNLTSDLPDESSPLGQETLPPRDTGGRGPGGDLCSLRSVNVRSSQSSNFRSWGIRTVAGVGATDETCNYVSNARACIASEDIRTGLLLHFLGHGGG